MNPKHQLILSKAYQAFNDRKIDDVLALMHEDVEWANGWEGGYVQGRDAVRDYWTRQWKEIDPEVKPAAFEENSENVINVKVRQLVRDKSSNILVDGNVFHKYFFENDLIRRMDIEEAQV